MTQIRKQIAILSVFLQFIAYGSTFDLDITVKVIARKVSKSPIEGGVPLE